MPDEVEEKLDQVLVVALGQDSFALPLGQVREILEYAPATPVPMTPDFVHGVLNLRGHVIPIIDLGRRLDRPYRAPQRHSCIVVVQVAGDQAGWPMGLIVDDVSEVADIAPQDRQTSPAFGANLRQEFVASLVRIGDGFKVLLDVDSVLCPQELAAAVQMAAA